MNVTINRQPLGVEDLAWGTGTQEQTRGGVTGTITEINAQNIPYDGVSTLGDIVTVVTAADWNAEAARLTAVSYATEAEDVVVNIVTSDGDGTYTYTPQIDVYSALHYKNKSVLSAGAAATSETNAGNSEDAALASETASEISQWLSEAARLTAVSYAMEAEDVVVNIVTSDGDGTYTYTPQTGIYSALHYSLKAATFNPALKVDKIFTNTDTIGAGILVGNNHSEWTKGFTSFTGALQIELTGLYNEASMVGRMKVVINQAVGDDRVFYIDGRWLSTTHTWDEANVLEMTTAANKLNVRFAKSGSSVFLVIGETTTSWNALRVMIDEVVTNYNASLDLGFVITSTTSLAGLTSDYTKVSVDNLYTDIEKSSLQSHLISTTNPHSVTKTQVGLGNVDNTSDVNKPVSTATSTALSGKVDKSVVITSAVTSITFNADGTVTIVAP